MSTRKTFILAAIIAVVALLLIGHCVYDFWVDTVAGT